MRRGRKWCRSGVTEKAKGEVRFELLMAALGRKGNLYGRGEERSSSAASPAATKAQHLFTLYFWF